jgi:hypothetical protein
MAWDKELTFTSIGDSEDPVGRMLGTLRFWFTKDLVWISVGHERTAAYRRSEICQGKACQTIQFGHWRVL